MTIPRTIENDLKPLQMLIGQWSGKGTGSYGPFTARVDVEKRGRWLLMRSAVRGDDQPDVLIGPSSADRIPSSSSSIVHGLEMKGIPEGIPALDPASERA